METVKNVVEKVTGPLGPPADPTQIQYTKYSDSIENIPADEGEKIQQLCEAINDNQQRNFRLHRHAFRGTHLKTQALVKGKLEVLPDLPEWLAQGMFSKPATYDIALRYANEPFKIMDDKINAPRGVGLRVFGVSGDKLNGQHETHDWTFNNAPVLELRNIDTYLEIESIRSKHWDNPIALKAALATRSDAALQLAPAMLPNENIVSHTMHTQAAFKYGDYVAKLSLTPATESQRALSSQKIGKDDPDNKLQEMLQHHFATQETTYDMQVQLMTDPKKQDVEDAGIDWSTHESPMQTVARITIPPQEAFSHARRTYWDDKMSLDAWNGLAAHRPLGSINRCRKGVYAASRKYRTETNCQPVIKTLNIGDIPD